MSLKVKFIVPALLLIIVGMTITTWLSYERSTKSLTALSMEKSKDSLNSLLSAVGLWVEGSQNEVITISRTKTIAAALTETGSESAKEAVMALINQVAARHVAFDTILVIDPKGHVVATTKSSLNGADLSGREYFKKAMAGQDYISNPVFSADTGQPVFVIAAPVVKDGQVVGTVSAGIKIDKFAEQFIKPLETPASYAYIVAPDGTALAHPDKGLIGKYNVFKEAPFGAEMASKSRGVLDTVSLGVEKLVLFEKCPRTGWVIGMTVNKAVAFADARELGLFILELSLGQALILIVGLWLILSLTVLKPLGALVGAAGCIADGNLDTKLDADRTDEIGGLQRAMSRMVATLKTKIGEAEDQGREALAASDKARQATAEAEKARQAAEAAREEGMLQAAAQLEDIVAAITAAAEAVSSQIGQSSRGSQEQSARVGETATAMEEMNATVIEVARSAGQAATTAENARGKADEGSRIVDQVIGGIKEVQAKALELKDDMTRLGQQAQGIGQVLEVISDIADQTNLLALNAAIEAARAGEAGRGFAVVADEVRKLAEKTMHATKEVGEAIAGIQQGTRKNVDNVDQAGRRIDEATALAGKSGEALAAIVTLVGETTDQVRSIATAAEQQSATTEEINRSVTDISRIAGETAMALERSDGELSGLADQTRMLRSLIDDMQGGAAKALPSGASGRKGLPSGAGRTGRPR